MLNFITGIALCSHAEWALEDSTEKALLHELTNGKNEKRVLQAINKQMVGYLEKDSKRAISFGLRVLEKSLDLDESIQFGDIHNTIASAFMRKELLGMALDYYDKGLGIFTHLDHKSGMAWNHISIGNVYFKQEFYDLASQQYFESSMLFEALADSNGLAVSLANLGLIKFKYRDYKQAENYMHRAINLREKDNIKYSKASIRIPVVELYIETGQLYEAEKYLNDAWEICANECSKDVNAKLNFLNEQLLMEKEKYDSAEEQFLSALSMGNRALKINFLHHLIQFYTSQNQMDNAIEMTNALMEFAKQHDLLNLNAEAHQILGNIYIEMGGSEKALDLLNQTITIVNDIRKENVTEVTARTEVAREVRAWEKNIQRKTKKSNTKN